MSHEDATSPSAFRVAVKNIILALVAGTLVAAMATILFSLNGCSSPADPVIVPLVDGPCPPKHRCLFDSTGAVIAVVPDTCGCDGPIL